MARWAPAAACAAGVLALAWFAMAPVRVLEMADDASGRTIARWHLAEGEEFVLSYTHSMYGGRVYERFSVLADGRLVRREMGAERAAAAEYYGYTVGAIPRDDGYVVPGPAAYIPELVLRVDGIGLPALAAGGRHLRLADAVGDGTPVRLRAVFLPRVAVLLDAS